MAFELICKNCGNKQTFKHETNYVSAKNIDLLATTDFEDDDELEFFCNNEECKSSIKIWI